MTYCLCLHLFARRPCFTFQECTVQFLSMNMHDQEHFKYKESLLGINRFLLPMKTQINLVNRTVMKEFVCNKMYRTITSFLVFAYSCVAFLFEAIYRHLSRSVNGNQNCKGKELHSKLGWLRVIDHQVGSSSTCSDDSQIYKNNREDNSKYEFLMTNGIDGLFEEQKYFCFPVQEFLSSSGYGCSLNKNTSILESEEEEIFAKSTSKQDGDGSSVTDKGENEEISWKQECWIPLEETNTEMEVLSSKHEFSAGETTDLDDSVMINEVTKEQEQQTSDLENLTNKEKCIYSNKKFYCRNDSPVFVDLQEPILTRSQKTESDDGGIGMQEKKQNSRIHNSGEEDNTIGLMLEHKELIEQLKMELKQARSGSLPTIFEELETEEPVTPLIVQEAKQLKITEKKFEHKDFMDEIQKVYKSYSGKMRKFDVLNYQTMHALGLHQQKEAFSRRKARKASAPELKSNFSQNSSWSCKNVGGAVNPIKVIVAVLEMDLESVYVGQICLSWEILHWQYLKAKEMQKHDAEGSYQYNLVGGEFQLFQALIQKFIENESFLGSCRIKNYVRNRCVLCHLLQVPVIRDDCLNERNENGHKEHTITIQTLTEIIKEVMQMFLKLVRADKYERNLPIHSNLQAGVNLELLMNLRTDLHKKEKKLRDLIRWGKYMVKKLRQENQETQVYHTLLVVQVELRLVSRVLTMSKITSDQLIWCRKKLDNINFCNMKKVHVETEPSCLLFPC